MRPLLLLCVLLGLTSVQSNAQHRVYAELGGNAGFISANYEYGVTRHIGLRIGFGSFLWFNVVPVTASYLTGNGPHHLELGAGLDFVLSELNSDDDEWFDFEPDVAAFGVGILGYRFMNDSGFMARITLTPFLTGEGAAVWAGVGLGWSF